MGKSSVIFASFSILMSALFAYSAAVQLNDPDWYFWFPLYSSACLVNFFHNTSTSARARRMSRLAFWLGFILFLKVVIEDNRNGLAGFWCLDLGKRVVREKLGSGLVVISMLVHLLIAQD